MGTDIGKEIADILDDYSDKAVRAIEHSTKKAASATVKQLKANATRGKTGDYASGFASKKDGSGKQGGYVVYNRSKPGLTHLLENGHAIANQYGRQGGRVNGKKHWAPAEQEGIEVFEREVRSELGG